MSKALQEKVAALEAELSRLKAKGEKGKAKTATDAEKEESQRRFVRQVRDRERRFQNMNPSQKRVAVAKDVLAMIEARRIRARAGTYLSLQRRVKGVKPETEVQEILLESPTCTACAVGSIFVCTMLRNDNLTINEFTGDPTIDRGEMDRDALGSGDGLYDAVAWLFSKGQLALIEAAFEGGYVNCYPDYGSDTEARAEKFHDTYTSDEKRLAAIMQNIIDNKGTFVLPEYADDDDD
jgi:hypothetical protein